MSDGRISLVEALPDELVSSSDLPEGKHACRPNMSSTGGSALKVDLVHADACEQLLDRVEARVQELAGDGSTGVCLVIDSLTVRMP
jgi:hypothetical protein